MKAAIYTPYLDTFGGGEKYMMTIAETLSQNGFEVDVLLDQHLDVIGEQYLKEELIKRFDLKFQNVNFIKAPLGKGSTALARLFFFKKYRVLFYLTDGSIFIPGAKKNILHIQSPLPGPKSFWGRLKLNKWNLIIYNSQFTKLNSLKNWPLRSKVIYPPVDTDYIKPLKKKKYILSVGRFFGYLRDKKHEIMIDTFRSLYYSKRIIDWSLHLVGSASEGDLSYLKELQSQAGYLPVFFHPNISFQDLAVLYGQSSIYWHAAGYGENDPAKMEHFGISTVEGMAGGCVPVVIGKGGQIEIVDDGESGFLWSNLEELEEKTVSLIENKKLFAKLSKNAIKKANKFDKKNFKNNIKDLLSKI